MNDIKQLLELIKQDKNKSGSYDRYPSRFLFLNIENNMKDKIIELHRNLNSMFNETEIIELSNLLNHDDGWLTKSFLLDYINGLDKSKDYIVLGFSELVRFFSAKELEVLLISLMTDVENTSNHNKQRIYFVCFSLYDNIQEKLKTNRRNESVDPIIKIDTDITASSDRICVYYANNLFDDAMQYNKIEYTKDWLSIYNNKNLKLNDAIVCVSDTLVELYEKAKPDNFVAIEKIDSYFKLLTLIKKIDINKAMQSEFSEDFWKKLYEFCDDNNCYSVDNATRLYLNIINIDEGNILDRFEDTDSFGKSLLHLYIKEHSTSNYYYDYLIEIFDNTIGDDYKSLHKNIFTNFDINSTTYYLEGRKVFAGKLLNKIFEYKNGIHFSINKTYQSFLTSNIYGYDFSDENINELNVSFQAQKYGITEERIINILKEYYNDHLKKMLLQYDDNLSILIILFRNKIIDFSELEKTYPDLIGYIGSTLSSYTSTNNKWIEDYLYNYKMAKINDCISPLFEEMIANTANRFSEWYINDELKYPLEEIRKEKDYDTLIVFDGVGSEYFSYLIYLLNKHNVSILHSNIAKCFLPSITSENKMHYEGLYDEWVYDFDKYMVHNEFYNSERNLPKALDLIEQLLLSTIKKYNDKRIAIIADHGVTALGKIKKSNKKYNYEGAEHEGRCMKVSDFDEISLSDDYCIYSKDNGEKWLLATREISLCDNPKRETHGGATIEEVTIPCIVFTNEIKTEEEIKYNIQVTSKAVSGLNRIVEMSIVPKPKEPPIFIEDDNTSHIMVYDDNDRWKSDVKNIRSQDAKVDIHGKQYGIHIISSIGDNQEGDWFDD